MEIRMFIMLNTDSRKSFKKLAGSSSHRTVPPLFCDFIIAYISHFFNWHFSRSFQMVFVEQGEVSATFPKRIYKKDFLWYNKNVGACLQTSPIFYQKPCALRSSAVRIRPLGIYAQKNKRHLAANIRKKWNNPWSRFPTQPRVISVHSWYLTSFLVLSFFLLG